MRLPPAATGRAPRSLPLGKPALAPHVQAALARAQESTIQAHPRPPEARLRVAHVQAALDRSRTPPSSGARGGPPERRAPVGQPCPAARVCLPRQASRPAGSLVVQRAEKEQPWQPTDTDAYKMMDWTGIELEQENKERSGAILNPEEYYARRNILHEINAERQSGNEGVATFSLGNGKTVWITSKYGAGKLAQMERFAKVPRIDIQKIYPDDTRGAPIEKRAASKKLGCLKDCAAAIHDALQGGNELVIYCNHGRSRSPSALGAYLMIYLGKSKTEALNTIVTTFGMKAFLIAMKAEKDEQLGFPPLHATLAKVPTTHQSPGYQSDIGRPELNVEQDLAFLEQNIQG